jgi:uncharacterized protein (TIGR03437 family)
LFNNVVGASIAFSAVVRNCLLSLTLLVGYAPADPGCPQVSFTSARSATLAPSPGVHRVLLKQSDGSYTAFELNNTSPYRVLRTIPHFEKQLSACAPTATGLPPLGLFTVAQLASGGYIFAMQGAMGATDIAVFDAQLNLVSEASYTDLAPLGFADLNGDGIPDLIGTAIEIAHQEVLGVALGTGGANFQPPVIYPIAGGLSSITAIAVADVNGDHKPDIVVSTIDPGSVSVLLGNGDGTFQPDKIITSANTPDELVLADLNGDGIADLVFTDMDPSNDIPIVEVALGTGGGTFSKPVSYSVAGGGVTIGDVNGDGVPDIVTNGVTILFGDGKGGFGSRRDFLVEASGDPIVTDFNGDGIADVVLGMGNPAIIAGDTVTVLSGLGQEQFSGPPISLVPNYPAADTLFDAMATADVNGDGIPDLVSVDFVGHVSVLLGAGDGSFQPSFQFTFTSGLPYGLVVADFNRDGRPDLAVVGSGYAPGSSGEVDILLGNGDGTFQQPIRSVAPMGAFALFAGYFHDDGKLDLAVLVSQEGAGVSDSVLILIGKGDGTFIAGDTYPVGPWAHSVVAGDFNGDGKLDLVVADAGTYAKSLGDGNISFLAGKGDGTFQAPSVIGVNVANNVGPYSMIAADFNGDGKLDLALTLCNDADPGGGLVTMLGRGDGTFQPPTFYAVEAVTVYAGDLNGDGIPDLIVSGFSGLHYLLGNGDGSFAPPVQFSSDGFTLYAESPLALADFNRDGKLDVAAIDSAGIDTFLNAATPTAGVTVVSAASLTPGPIAPDSIATAFGKSLPATAASISIKDSTGATFSTSVLYASANQINFVIPAGLDAGPVTFTIQSAGGSSTAQSASVLIAPVAPSLFTVNDTGLAAAYVTHVAPGGASTNEPILTLKNGVYTPVPIDVTSGQTYLILFGTGIRNGVGFQATSSAQEIGAVLYAGPQPSFQGLDQVNLLLPPTLAGSGCINVLVASETLASNTVFMCIH